MSDVTQGICHGALGWGQVEQMTSSADPVPLANRELLCVPGAPDHTAVPVPLQQKVKSWQSTHIGHRSPWPLQTTHILHRGETVTTCVHTEGNNPKILNLDLGFLT